MNRKFPLLLFMFLFLLGSGITTNVMRANPVAATPKRPLKTERKQARHHKTKKIKRHQRIVKRVKKETSISLLREYLPEYADIPEAQNVSNNDAFVEIPHGFDFHSPFASNRLRLELIRNIDRWLGTRYRYGGSSHRGVDCSGFTSTVISRTLNFAFQGNSRWQAGQFIPIFAMDSLQFGDMLFFTGRNRNSGRIGHVGIYLGNGVFAHSSTGRGVIYSHISEGYYSERFRWGGRFTTGSAEVLRDSDTIIQRH